MSASEIELAVRASRFAELAQLCERLELEAFSSSADLAPMEGLHSLTLLGHLFNGDLMAAKLLWKGLPDSAKQSDKELKAAWKVGQALILRDPGTVHATLRGYAWGPLTKPLAAALQVQYTQSMLTLLETAYSAVRVDDAATALGLDPTDTTSLLTRRGWILDPSSGTLSFERPSETADDSRIPDQLHKLTTYVFHLEQ